MPQAILLKLELTRQGDGSILIDFSYRAVFSFAEMEMTKCGMTYREKVDVIGVDPPGSKTGEPIPIFNADENQVRIFGQTRILPVSSWDGIPPRPSAIHLKRHYTTTVSRAQLDEDPSHPLVGPDFDPDEIRCRVELTSRQEPVVLDPVIGFSNEKVLGEPVVVNDNILVVDTEVITA
jgi:hypothetical protein